MSHSNPKINPTLTLCKVTYKLIIKELHLEKPYSEV